MFCGLSEIILTDGEQGYGVWQLNFVWFKLDLHVYRATAIGT